MQEARPPSYWWCYECRKEVTPEPGVALDLNLNLNPNPNPNPVCGLCQQGFLERIYASSSVAVGVGIGSPHGSRLLWNEPPQSLYFHDFFGFIRSSPYRALSLDDRNHDHAHSHSNEREGERAVDYLDCFSDGLDSDAHFSPEGRIVEEEEEEEQLWENLGVSENFYAASEGEVEPGTSRRWEESPRMIWDEFEVKIDPSRDRLEEPRRVRPYEIEMEGESFIRNADPRDDGIDEATKNSLSLSRNSEGNDLFFTALADDPADAESVGSNFNSVEHSGSPPYPRVPFDGCPGTHAEMGDLMLAFNAWDSFEVHDEEESEDDEQWEEVLGEEAAAAATVAADAAEVNFDFGSTEGIVLPVADEEEEEQGSDAEDSRSLPLLERSELAGMMQMLVNFNLEEDVEEEEDDDGDVYYGVPEDYVDAAGYEIVLQHQHEHEYFAENNDDFLTGAPPAAKAAVECLTSFWIGQKDLELVLMCAICKDPLSLGELAKQLPCLHSYHADCILPWLSSRNSCPLCRYELPTDDPAYEEQRKQGASLRT